MKPTSISNSNAVWAFIVSTDELRHINDVIFSLDILITKKKVNPKDIYLYTDFPNVSNVVITDFGYSINIDSITNYTTSIGLIAGKENLILIVGGHGSSIGIESVSGVLSPENLLSSVSQNQHFKHCAVILGQCYAGIFNFLDAKRNVEFCLIGATNLSLTLSDFVSLKNPITSSANASISLTGWTANLFLLFFFIWIEQRIDVDGDGTESVLDAYKFAGTQATEFLKKTSLQLHLVLQKKINRKLHLEGLATRSTFEEVELKTLQKELNRLCMSVFNKQDPWVLNAIYGRFFEVNV